MQGPTDTVTDDGGPLASTVAVSMTTETHSGVGRDHTSTRIDRSVSDMPTPTRYTTAEDGNGGGGNRGASKTGEDTVTVAGDLTTVLSTSTNPTATVKASR